MARRLEAVIELASVINGSGFARDQDISQNLGATGLSISIFPRRRLYTYDGRPNLSTGRHRRNGGAKKAPGLITTHAKFAAALKGSILMIPCKRARKALGARPTPSSLPGAPVSTRSRSRTEKGR